MGPPQMQFSPTMQVGASGNGSGLLACDQLIFFTDQDRISSHNIKQTGNENKKDISIMGLLFDLTPNTPK